MRNKALAMVGALVAAVVSVGPVAAAKAPQDTSCRYEATQAGQFGWTEARLKRISVRPPEMFALDGSNSQRVSWRFMVGRYIGSDPYAAKETYRSPRQYATAARDEAAPFSPMGVDVKLPTVSGDHELTDVHYVVLINQVWYNADGTRYQSGLGSRGVYRVYVDGEFQSSSSDFEGCAGGLLQFYPHN